MARTSPRKLARSTTSQETSGGEIEALGGALLLVDGRGKVVRARNWEKVFSSAVPERLETDVPGDDPVVAALSRTFQDARRRQGVSRSVVELCLTKQRFYSIAAAPGGAGAPAGTTLILAFEMTDSFQPGPREGDAIRQLGHDLRSPLTSMSGAVEMMQSGRYGSLSGQQERLLSMMQKGIDMMMTLIEEATAPYRGAQGRTHEDRGRAAAS